MPCASSCRAACTPIGSRGPAGPIRSTSSRRPGCIASRACCRCATGGCAPRRSPSCAVRWRSWRPILRRPRAAASACRPAATDHANFGTYSSPEGTPVFDVNDFDETLPAPFEWDLKRLATSFAVDARARNMSDKAARQLARTAAMAYRIHMADLVRLGPLRAWSSRIDVAEALATIDDIRVREREERRVEAILDAMARRNWPKLIERRDGAWRIRERPPLVFPLGTRSDDTHEIAARTAFASYRSTLPEERRLLLDRFKLEDVAFKVVGVGSVGTFCAIGLFANPDGDTLLLQIKEAQTSALAPYAGPSDYRNQGQRVVVGQRIMQAVSDIFLCWTQDPGDDRHCYVRQLKDSRLALVATEIAEGALGAHALLCGRTLARAHARSGDAAQIAGYMGSGTVVDAA